MSKGTRFVTFAVPAVIAYFLLLLHVLPTPFLAQETADQILPVIPWWLLVAFGAYSLSSLGLGLLRFHDTPEAYQSLLGEIQQAKNELRDQGVRCPASCRDRDHVLLRSISGRDGDEIPWWLLVAFGAYSLSSLGLGLLRFHDTPEAYQSLLGEIQQAKNELRDQGVEVD
ncbi:hypothetical protein A1Q2_04421 [Trichosporon asahii var. asahii CBS 8904]|uniref:Dolichol-phosphate mannosyltransferase subunit 3 n=1 Tax=Trichosporon asahii var. asahii (strain CBS 8904) TaxID=1220162 RepID=K1WIM4_TRIAC|nr:hypothetical protein A1Q2_04421 [Trichosporon asahii var. asahii CBS 8904]